MKYAPFENLEEPKSDLPIFEAPISMKLLSRRTCVSEREREEGGEGGREGGREGLREGGREGENLQILLNACEVFYIAFLT